MKTQNLLRLFVAFTCLSLFIACQKDVQPTEMKPPVLTSKDPQSISSALKVWHGERKQGNAPTPNGAALVLDPPASITHAFVGRYAIIEPEVAQGDIAGYYLQVNGAKEFFKIDYSKPRGGRLGNNRKPTSPFGGQQSRTMTGNADSAIVLVLPANLQVPDTFCVSYCAYDLQGNVSNVITTCVVVNSLGTTTGGEYLHGVWKNTASWDTSFASRDTVIFNRWTAQTYNAGYACYQDPNTGISSLNYNYNGLTPLVMDSNIVFKSHLTFGVNGGLKYEYEEKTKNVNLSTSTCSQFFFDNSNYNDNFTGAWNYNPTTGKMVLVFEFDLLGIPTLEAYEYQVIKLNNNHIVLKEDDNGYAYHVCFEK